MALSAGNSCDQASAYSLTKKPENSGYEIEPRLVLALRLIGWKSGASFAKQSQNEVKRTRSKESRSIQQQLSWARLDKRCSRTSPLLVLFLSKKSCLICIHIGTANNQSDSTIMAQF